MVLFSDFWMQWCLLWFSLCSEIPTTRGIIYFGFSMSLNQQQGGFTERWSCPSLNPCENSHRRGRIHLLGALWEPIPTKHRNPPLLTKNAVSSSLVFGDFPGIPRAMFSGIGGGAGRCCCWRNTFSWLLSTLPAGTELFPTLLFPGMLSPRVP